MGSWCTCRQVFGEAGFLQRVVLDLCARQNRARSQPILEATPQPPVPRPGHRPYPKLPLGEDGAALASPAHMTRALCVYVPRTQCDRQPRMIELSKHRQAEHWTKLICCS